jgi:hypothetical protein
MKWINKDYNINPHAILSSLLVIYFIFCKLMQIEEMRRWRKGKHGSKEIDRHIRIMEGCSSYVTR